METMELVDLWNLRAVEATEAAGTMETDGAVES